MTQYAHVVIHDTGERLAVCHSIADAAAFVSKLDKPELGQYAIDYPCTLDTFTRAYIEAALWSSTCEPFGTCPCCERENQVLNRWPEEEYQQEYVCSECGSREPHYEPPMDENYSIDDLAPETLARMVADCERFQTEQADWLSSEYCPKTVDNDGAIDVLAVMSQGGHDFWLTRNGHGCGFWDGDWTEPAATKLTDASKAFGEMYLYVGDDGRIYA